MELFEAIQKRHMCRDFEPEKDVSEELVEKIIEAGKAAPSSGGLRDQRFLAIRDSKIKEALRKVSRDQETLTDAPVVIAVSSDIDVVEAKYGERGRELYAAQNSAAAMENMLLAVTALGLGACWVGAFEEEAAKEILGLPENQKLMALMPVGHVR
jgi:SagB-type dehydrogenase family enzyme